MVSVQKKKNLKYKYIACCFYVPSSRYVSKKIASPIDFTIKAASTTPCAIKTLQTDGLVNGHVVNGPMVLVKMYGCN